MVDAPEIAVVDGGVRARQRFGRRRQPAEPAGPLALPSRGQGPVGEPLQEADAEGHGDEAVDEEHQPEAGEPSDAVHELEAG